MVQGAIDIIHNHRSTFHGYSSLATVAATYNSNFFHNDELTLQKWEKLFAFLLYVHFAH
jgi:hypothetical protein